MRLTGAKDIDDLRLILASQLSARERDVIVRRQGVTTGQVETLASIARKAGVSVERIRQVEARGMFRLAGRLRPAPIEK